MPSPASDLQRARRTAELAGAAIGLSTGVRVDAGLREYDIGEWSGLTRAEIEARWPRALDEWRHERRAAPPGGERRDEFRARIMAAVSRLDAAGPTGPVLVITHGGVIGELEQSFGVDRHRWDHLNGRWFEGSGDERRPGRAVCLSGPGSGVRPADGSGAGSEVAVRDRPTAEGEGAERSSPGGSPTSMSCSRASYLPRS